jgi:hypothetical protein
MAFPARPRLEVAEVEAEQPVEVEAMAEAQVTVQPCRRQEARGRGSPKLKRDWLALFSLFFHPFALSLSKGVPCFEGEGKRASTSSARTEMN